MKKIYLDLNVVVDGLHENRAPGIKEKIEGLLDAGVVFPFSPAHLEETAVICQTAKKDARKYVIQQVKYISKISKNHGLMPSDSGPVVLRIEDPKACLYRVVKGLDKTLFAEMVEGSLHGDVDSYRKFREHYKLDPLILKKVEPGLILGHKDLENPLKHEAIRTTSSLSSYSELKNDFSRLRDTIDFLMRFLEKCGYFSDDAKNYRSRMHDVTHAIYATAADEFVIGDRKFRKKVEAVYAFLGVSTLVCSRDEFLTR
ncbi:hypothetical protein ABQZ69_17775 [Xanthomonas sp. WHRI 8391]|uniref:hypothetical protein n=1 Tax=Xanthomonas sp. WHRI 8391 TaxID=3161573 RepID=UPI001A34407D|nr:hypothetical protein [Xanthomonas hortorum pv. carotae]